ncbi:MAG: hypothetical protein GX443_13600 [Deltaproteobacteria bacterium]|nr:hypothetical protein [Deltaproteobacteria bacterium]
MLAADHRLPLLFRIALLCDESEVLQEEGEYGVHGDPTEGALIVSAMKAGLKTEEEKAAFPQIVIVPLESNLGRKVF